MTKLELDLLSNGFNEKDLKRIKKAIKAESETENEDEVNDDSLIKEIKNLRSCFLMSMSVMLLFLFIVNITYVLEKEAVLELILLNLFIIVFFLFGTHIVIPISLGFKSCKYR